MIGCIKCHGPTDHDGACHVCDAAGALPPVAGSPASESRESKLKRFHDKWDRHLFPQKCIDLLKKDLAAAHASLREMIDLNETTGDPDPAITERARALLPENAIGEARAYNATSIPPKTL